MAKPLYALKDEFRAFHFRLFIMRLLLVIFPSYTAFRVRRFLFRLIGFSVGDGTAIFDTPTIVGDDNIYKKLIIGKDCLIGPQGYYDLAGRVIIHDRAGLGPRATVITGTHKIGPASNRVGPMTPADVEIGEGVWIGAGCTILPGVKIGNGAVVAAGALVNKDVAENTLVGGVPARVIRVLEE